jgi:predicted regulator of Ras-like GTPase activity (Roadblock/LC7/MglB family)
LELERVLSKLRYDESVSGYALITNDGQPFLSFSLPDEALPPIQGALRIHESSLRLMNIMTDAGTVILARVDPEWILGVLFEPTESLGSALQKVKDVARLLEDVTLPPPPAPIEHPIPAISEVGTGTSAAISPAVEETPRQAVMVKDEELIPSDTIVRHGCVILRGVAYPDALRIDSALNIEFKKQFANVGVDVLLMVDEKRTVIKIADILSKRVEQVLEVAQWCLQKGVVDAECPEAQEARAKKIVELPLFEGKIKKAKKNHRDVLELCDGTRTVHEIAEELGMLYFNALQCIVPYRGKNLKMVRKTRE